ncbi:MAG: Ig-like domain repeat protein [Deltaproteobacteria bacterium]|nr:Ig-like domain repeat protein [Deltaproteobacteria bacterium]
MKAKIKSLTALMLVGAVVILISGCDDTKVEESPLWNNLTVNIESPVLDAIYNRADPDLSYTVTHGDGTTLVPDEFLKGSVFNDKTGDRDHVEEIVGMKSGMRLPARTDGSHVLEFVVLDLNMQPQVTVSVGYATDTASPEVAINSPQGLVCVSTPVLGFTGGEGDTVSVLVDGVAVEAASGGALGPLADGKHELQVLATDSAGNPGSAMTAFLVDTTAPLLSVAQPENNAVSNTQPLLLFSANEAVDVQVLVGAGDEILSTRAVAAGGGEMASLQLELSAGGAYEVELTAIDRCGNTATENLSLLYDPDAPVVSLQKPTGLYNTKTVPLIYTVLDMQPALVYPDVEVRLHQVGGSGEIVSTLNLSPAATSIAVPADGNYKVEVLATDMAGNTGRAEMAFAVDTVSPQVSVLRPAGLICQENPPLVFTSTESGQVQVLLDGRLVSRANGEGLGPLSNGKHTVRVIVTDEAGNQGSASTSFNVDTGAPEITIAQPVSGSMLGAMPVLSFTVSENSGTQVVLASQGVGVSQFSLEAQAGEAIVVDLGQQAAGEYSVSILAQDVCQNTSLAETGFILDPDAPAVTVNSPSGLYAEALVPLDYSVADLSLPLVVPQVEVTLHTLDAWGTVIASRPVVADAQTIQVQGDGDYLVEVLATDAAGNTGRGEALFSVDTMPPEIVIASPGHMQYITTDTPVLEADVLDQHMDLEAPGALRIFVYPGEYSGMAGFQPIQGALGAGLSYEDGSPLADGLNTVVLAAVDLLGNESVVYSTFEVNSRGPVLTILNPDPALIHTFSHRNISIRYNASETTLVRMFINGEEVGVPRVINPVQPIPRTYQESLYFEADGVYTLTLEARDDAGGFEPVTASATFAINFDLPAVVIQSPQPGNNIFPGLVSLTFTAYNSTSARVLVNGLEQSELGLSNRVEGETLSQKIGPFSENGDYVLSVEVTDGMVTATSSATFTIDTKPPVVSISNPEEGSELTASAVTVLYTVSDANATGSAEVSLDGALLAMAEGSLLVTGLADGPHVLSVRVTDAGGNVGSAVVTFTVNTAPPPIPEPPPDTTPPGEVTMLESAAGDGEATLSWVNPADADLVALVVRRSTDSSPLTPDDGVAVDVGSDPELYQPGSSVTVVDSGLENGVTYYYTVFAFDDSQNVTGGAAVSVQPEARSSLPAALEFSAMREWPRVNHEWSYDLPQSATIRIPVMSDITVSGDTERYLVKLSLGNTHCFYRGGDWQGGEDDETSLDVIFESDATCVGNGEAAPGASLAVDGSIAVKVIVSGRYREPLTAAGTIQIIQWHE